MKIERNGIEIELTKMEMISAYYEQQHKWDVEYITGNLLEQYEECLEEGMVDQLRNNADFADRVAYRYREYLEDSYGSDREFECLEDAYDYMLKCDN